MQTVFITGATGFIGRALCVRMLEKGWRVLGTFREKSFDRTLPAGVDGIQIEDIENCDYVRRELEGVDTLIHLAGRAHVMNDTASDPFGVFRKINVVGTERLARAAARAGVRKFIFVSSIKVNGESSQIPYTEKDVPAPQDPYGVSKYEAEQALQDIAAKTGIKTVILRPPLVYGPGVRANFETLIKLVARTLPLPLKNIYNRRSFIYLGNLTDAIFTSVVNPKADGEIFMVSDCRDISTPDLVRLIASAMGRKAALFSLPPALLRTLARVVGKGEELERLTGSLFVDTGKIMGVLNWKPPFTLEEGIKETVGGIEIASPPRGSQ